MYPTCALIWYTKLFRLEMMLLDGNITPMLVDKTRVYPRSTASYSVPIAVCLS